jgi:NitT/TauT family transport system permease protein
VARGPIGATSRVVRGGRRRWLATWGPPAAVFVASIGVCYGVSYQLLDPRRRFLVPPPHDVIRVSFPDPFNLNELLDALWLSTRVAFIGLFIAIVLGWPWPWP